MGTSMNRAGMSELLLLLMGRGGKWREMGIGRKKWAWFLVNRMQSASPVKRDVWSQPGCFGGLTGWGGVKDTGQQCWACSLSSSAWLHAGKSASSYAGLKTRRSISTGAEGRVAAAVCPSLSLPLSFSAHPQQNGTGSGSLSSSGPPGIAARNPVASPPRNQERALPKEIDRHP